MTQKGVEIDQKGSSDLMAGWYSILDMIACNVKQIFLKSGKNLRRVVERLWKQGMG